MVKDSQNWDWRLGLAGFLVIGGAIVFWNNCALAQITPDGTLGAERSQIISPIPGGFVITGGATRGTNLFHSFQEFSVPTDGFAYFNNARNIQNIMARVTGGSVSNIDGWIAANGTANLFLINPKGIIFGANAQLDIGGSFLASTANSFTFPNGIAFSATNPQAPPLLTINVPIGLQYGSNPGNIVNQAAATDSDGRILGLQVQPGKSIALVGGDVTLSGGGLSAVEGRVEIGGLTTSGIVGLTVDGNTLHLSVPDDIPRGNVTLTNDARVGVRGVRGGDIIVNANNFTATNGGRLIAGTEGTGDAGDITVNAINTFNIAGIGVSGFESGLFNQALPNSTGNAGNIFVNTQSFQASSGGAVRSDSDSLGNAGDISINARTVNLSGVPTEFGSDTIGSNTFEQGHAGNVRINAETLTIRDGASVGANTSGSGSGGTVTVNASESVDVSGLASLVQFDGNFFNVLSSLSANTDGNGNAGNLTINTKKLMIRDGAGVGAWIFGSGSGGNVTINSSESVELSGTSTINYADIGINLTQEQSSLLTTATQGSGNAGNLTINTGRLIVRDGGSITANTFAGNGNAGSLTIHATDVEVIGESTPGILGTTNSRIWANTLGAGNAGNITIEAERLIVQDGASISTFTHQDSGNAGFITVRAKDMQLIGTSANGVYNSGLTAGVGQKSTGNGGGVAIEAERVIVRDGALIDTNTLGNGNAGFITVRAKDVELSGISAVFPINRSGLSSKTFGSGSGGEINVDTERLIIRDGALISSDTTLVTSQGATNLTGHGGNIVVRASELVDLMGTSPVFGGFHPSSISSETSSDTPNIGGNGGTISIETGRLTLRDGAAISASSQGGSGNAGAVNVQAREVDVIGTSANGQYSQFPSRISADVGFSLTFRSPISGTNGNGGSVSLETEQLTIRDGAEISTSTYDRGNAGSVNVRARNVELIGTSDNGSFASRLSAQALSRAVGNGGSVTVDTEQLTVRDLAQINVGNQGIGNAGNLHVAANSILLDNQGQLNAASTSGKGGSINLQANNLLLMRRNSLISAVNGTPNSFGLDGNITINTQFLVAVPSENSDIVANGFGRSPGSNIQITAQGIFGTEFRERLTPKSDIVATGKVTLNTPDVDPSRGLAELPTNVVNAEELIDRHCTPSQSTDRRSSFTVTGRGGLPPSPNEPLRNEEVITNWITLPSEEENRDAATNNQPTNSTNQPLVEAQGWAINEQGQVVLTADTTTVTPQTSWLPSPSCPSSQTGTQ